ncbi:unnamed protein product [Hymenolepis diminuta]|uniref:DUF5727 domain-containing protein n=2 Tax=Hymenolepis diminuta TaxID=6216 RepID=A0A564YBX0_HYMDI|nr:unnamed protein product [Hymenolepis diminuta]
MISLTSIICVLLSIGTISAQEMWGSRIITKPSGSVTDLKFAYETGNVFGVFDEVEFNSLTIKDNDKCQVGDKVIGEPCSIAENTATISFDNVEKYKAFTIGKSMLNNIPLLAAFMIPDCKFEETLKGKVDLKTSAPLTRFAKGRKEVDLDFGVRPGDTDIEAELYHNGELVCTWVGKTLKENKLQSCKDLEPSADNKLLVTRVTIQREGQVAKDNYLWFIPNSFVTVSVDWENEGVAPEVAECESTLSDSYSHGTYSNSQ